MLYIIASLSILQEEAVTPTKECSSFLQQKDHRPPLDPPSNSSLLPEVNGWSTTCDYSRSSIDSWSPELGKINKTAIDYIRASPCILHIAINARDCRTDRRAHAQIKGPNPGQTNQRMEPQSHRHTSSSKLVVIRRCRCHRRSMSWNVTSGVNDEIQTPGRVHGAPDVLARVSSPS